jgi:hypothetical protein
VQSQRTTPAVGVKAQPAVGAAKVGHELMIRADVERCLIVAPGSLVTQWQDERWDRFGRDR